MMIDTLCYLPGANTSLKLTDSLDRYPWHPPVISIATPSEQTVWGPSGEPENKSEWILGQWGVLSPKLNFCLKLSISPIIGVTFDYKHNYRLPLTLLSTFQLTLSLTCPLTLKRSRWSWKVVGKEKLKTSAKKNLHRPQVILHVRPKNWQSVSGDFIIHSQIFKSEQFSYLDIPICR